MRLRNFLLFAGLLANAGSLPHRNPYPNEDYLCCSAGLRRQFLLQNTARVQLETRSPKIRLEVTSQDVDVAAHEVAVHLLNHSPKTVVAYMLRYRILDVPGKLMQTSLIGWDSDALSMIPPGQTGIRLSSVNAETVALDVAVVGVVYDDRTYEGDDDYTQPFFVGRADCAKELRKAISILTPYPQTSDAMQTALKKLRALPQGAGPRFSNLANHISTTFTAVSALAALEDLVGEPGASDSYAVEKEVVAIVPTKEQMDSVIAELSAQAAKAEEQSQAVRP